ncbi:MAG TPA: glycosyltransferase, partial [Gaiellaceae bacterium]|nr:glycosyltransferase [Gaiellaceae bacterium]
MNVLFVTTSYPRPDSPIGGIFVREHARAAAEVADVRVLHLVRGPGARGLVPLERIAGEEPPAWRAPYRRFGKPLAQLAFVLGPLTLARRLRREGWTPDVIHAHSFLSALPALLLGRLLRRPVAYTEHWTIFLPENPGSLSPGMERLARFALARADVVLPVSADLERALRRLEPRARTRVVPNVVDDVFTPAARADGGPARLLTVGL